MLYKWPNRRIYDRETFILELCKGRNVLHIGACQADDASSFIILDNSLKHDQFLHSKISHVANQCIGFDYNKDAITYLQEKHGIKNIRYMDIQVPMTESIEFEPDVIVIGELVEHLVNPGLAMDTISTIAGQKTTVVITTPNSLSLLNVFGAILGTEYQNEDHSIIFSPKTISRLLDKCGFSTEALHWYHEQSPGVFLKNYFPRTGFSIKKISGFILMNVLLRLFPAYSMGLIAVARARK